MSEFVQPNANTYMTIKKIVSIHSEDRDITKFPAASLFDVQLPTDYKNIVSITLDNIDIPKSVYVFSNHLQNIKLTFYVTPVHTLGSGMSPTTFEEWDYTTGMALLQNKNGYTITVTEGNYSSEEMKNELTGLMNEAVTNYLKSVGITTDYTYFSIVNHDINFKFIFGNERDIFSFDFTKTYDYACPQATYNVYNQYFLWGLGSYLGFNKEVYTSVKTTDAISFFWAEISWFKPSGTDKTFYYIEPPNSYNLIGETQFYMELSGYNSIDEIFPYTERSSNMYNAKQNASIDIAFAKIANVQGETVTPNYNLTNSFFSDPPLERLQKIKVKLRYHNGLLVDLRNQNFNFSLSFNLLRPDIPKGYFISKPPTYLIK
jgi:hypothetical protein